VSPTEAGQRLLQSIGPCFEEIDTELAALSELRDTPTGTVRITAAEHAATSVVWPKLAGVLGRYPDIKVELIVDYRLTDIAAERFDLGVRLGDQVDKDMVAVRISPDLRMAVVGSPDCFAGRPLPATPHDLSEYRCINLRLPTYGGLYGWEFCKGDRELKVHVQGQLVFSSSPPIVRATLAGFGLACVPEDMVLTHIAEGRLQRVLEDWCPVFPGYHAYYPRRRQIPPALALVIDALRQPSADRSDTA
jgi:DNA-binding transcriptional LysR family regulator